jgi:hypothetical protein
MKRLIPSFLLFMPRFALAQTSAHHPRTAGLAAQKLVKTRKGKYAWTGPTRLAEWEMISEPGSIQLLPL